MEKVPLLSLSAYIFIHTWRNVLLDVVVVTEVDVVEESGAVVYVGVSIAPRDLSPWDCLK